MEAEPHMLKLRWVQRIANFFPSCPTAKLVPLPNRGGVAPTLRNDDTPDMKDPIVQEVRDARTAVAADFDFDLHKFFAWAKGHAAAERKARHWLPTGPKKALETTGAAVNSPAARKRRARPSGASTEV